ncbi:hypothetical protein [Micromonospora sp. WMMC273]|uniref:hypothetical protein n=1 Tax=Micromonospora sp. WMMC273 TaxID=3015157 RepID=UPI0022B6F6AF|nr:hypothetical protein [Micromonospora sp. WMMC273]MCZ7478886.1 hypothetical protein [Micromonospora sp. WMMC273]
MADSYLQGLRIRATRLDDCGAPVFGPCGTVVSKGFVNINLSVQETNPTEIAPVLADGSRCYYIQTAKLLNNIQASLEFCEVDPELFEMMTGSPLVLDDATVPKAQGFVTDSQVYGLANVALEVWTNLARGGCGVPGGRRWGYYLLPWLYQGTVSKPTIENGAVNFTVNEAVTRDGNQWGVGPYDIQMTSGSTPEPSPLFEPLTSTTHDLLYKVNMAPPAPTEGCVPLVAA